jgi:hypothetical protein
MRLLGFSASLPNPCFDDSYPKASADVLLEGIREQAERRGLPRMTPDVITFVITSVSRGKCLEILETIKFTIPHRYFRIIRVSRPRITLLAGGKLRFRAGCNILIVIIFPRQRPVLEV